MVGIGFLVSCHLFCISVQVRFGDAYRRFNVSVDDNNQIDLNMAGLRAKIRSIFDFTDEANFTLSYVDEDAEMVNLVDDNDLNDLMRQQYKFWRIYVRENGILPLELSQWRNMIHKSVCKLMQKEEAIYYGSAFVAWVGLLSAIIFAKPNVQVVQSPFPPPPPPVRKGWFS